MGGITINIDNGGASTLGGSDSIGSSDSSSNNNVNEEIQEIEELLQQLMASEGSPSSSAGSSPTSSLGSTPASSLGSTPTSSLGSTPAASSVPGSTDLAADGQSLSSSNISSAMSQFAQQDPSGFQAFQNAMSSGNGNEAAGILSDAVQSGKLSQSVAGTLAPEIQTTAKENGGGTLNAQAQLQVDQLSGQPPQGLLISA
ncbi:hypothetical protein CY652_16385 [Burkholderia sp. WAC0059]|uniref:hypothetical protein n=1 Tax=Burkholderia sp. WAC0059 TaxID=2066022 RepID=UPI000C7F3BED|nr:hypothetical protein [Burkholderia sp. WAC0059]PLZ01406.1 hypothetical protein CY652_16385 [Burkholderia sp. WAC0059]